MKSTLEKWSKIELIMPDIVAIGPLLRSLPPFDDEAMDRAMASAANVLIELGELYGDVE